MAKEQKRGSREARKPKQGKTTAADTSASQAKVASTPSATGKKKF